MITVETMEAFFKQITDKRGSVLLNEEDEELVILSTEAEVEHRRVLGKIHICGEELEDCEECGKSHLARD